MPNIADKKIYFISGLPRAGSTLLSNLLLQNPRFHASATSGIADVLFGVRNQWDNLIEFKAAPNDAAKVRVLQSILPAYYADIEKPIIFDKSRSWLSLLEMAETCEVIALILLSVKVRAPGGIRSLQLQYRLSIF